MNLFNSWLIEQPIAHRGLHDSKVPENSLTAFAKAIEAGYPIELAYCRRNNRGFS